MSKLFNIAAATALIFGATFSASAAGDPQIIVNEQGLRTVVVEYADLNLATAAGQDALSKRVEAAVRQVCGATYERQTLGETRDYRVCTTKASQQAFASLERQPAYRFARKQ